MDSNPELDTQHIPPAIFINVFFSGSVICFTMNFDNCVLPPAAGANTR